jgi:hypothetical protein
MTYGLYCLCSNNTVIDTTTITGVLQDALTLSTSSSGSLSYPLLTNRTIYIATIRSLIGIASAYSSKTLSFSIDYSPGYPIVNYSPIGAGNDYSLNVFVLVK